MRSTFALADVSVHLMDAKESYNSFFEGESDEEVEMVKEWKRKLDEMLAEK